jgi:hypothetical protein
MWLVELGTLVRKAEARAQLEREQGHRLRAWASRRGGGRLRRLIVEAALASSVVVPERAPTILAEEPAGEVPFESPYAETQVALAEAHGLAGDAFEATALLPPEPEPQPVPEPLEREREPEADREPVFPRVAAIDELQGVEFDGTGEGEEAHELVSPLLSRIGAYTGSSSPDAR